MHEYMLQDLLTFVANFKPEIGGGGGNGIAFGLVAWSLGKDPQDLQN